MARESQARKRQRRSSAERQVPAFLDDLLAMASSLAASRKDSAAAQIENLADAMRQFSDTLPSLPAVKTYAETAADGLEDLAGYVVESDLPEMIADGRDFARRHPLLTFGGSIAAGLIITQLVQSRTQSMRHGARTVRSRAARSRSADMDGAGAEDSAAA